MSQSGTIQRSINIEILFWPKLTSIRSGIDCTEVVRRSIKQVLLKILQNSQEIPVLGPPLK